MNDKKRKYSIVLHTDIEAAWHFMEVGKEEGAYREEDNAERDRKNSVEPESACSVSLIGGGQISLDHRLICGVRTKLEKAGSDQNRPRRHDRRIR